MSTELSCSHFQELIRVFREEERAFYINECKKSNLGYRELARQINTKLYDRYIISPDKDYIFKESNQKKVEKDSEELIKIIQSEKELIEQVKNDQILEIESSKEN